MRIIFSPLNLELPPRASDTDPGKIAGGIEGRVMQLIGPEAR
jgi:hypothetical protein